MNTTTTSTTPKTTPTTTIPTTARMSYEQAEMLATLVHSLRPDWGAKGMITALEKLVPTVDATTLTLGLIHASTDPNNRTPAIIHHPGKHWDRARGIATTTRPAEPKRADGIDTSPMCKNHPELHEWECKTCNQPTPPPPNFRQMIADAAEQFRKTINSALEQEQDDFALAGPSEGN